MSMGTMLLLMSIARVVTIVAVWVTVIKCAGELTKHSVLVAKFKNEHPNDPVPTKGLVNTKKVTTCVIIGAVTLGLNLAYTHYGEIYRAKQEQIQEAQAKLDYQKNFLNKPPIQR